MQSMTPAIPHLGIYARETCIYVFCEARIVMLLVAMLLMTNKKHYRCLQQ